MRRTTFSSGVQGHGLGGLGLGIRHGQIWAGERRQRPRTRQIVGSKRAAASRPTNRAAILACNNAIK